jgi:hypothetical protein
MKFCLAANVCSANTSSLGGQFEYVTNHSPDDLLAPDYFNVAHLPLGAVVTAMCFRTPFDQRGAELTSGPVTLVRLLVTRSLRDTATKRACVEVRELERHELDGNPLGTLDTLLAVGR